MSALKPCPFCGGPASEPFTTGVADGAGEFWAIECDARSCCEVSERGMAETVSRWNGRATDFLEDPE